MTKIENNKIRTDWTSSEIEKCIHTWVPYLNEMRFSYLDGIEGKSLTKEVVSAYIRHIPIEGINDGWPNEIYKITKKMIYELYNYSKEMGYILEDMPIEEFANL